MTESVVIHDSSGDTYRDESGALTNFPTTGGGAVSSVFTRTGAVAAVAGDYFGVVPAALTGATQAARFAGATTSGAPASGTWAVGDLVAARDGHIFMCISAGTPGTWVDTGGSISYATPSIALGSSAAAGAASTAIRSDSTIAAFDATAPTTQAFGDSAATGSAAVAARRDHKHAMPATPTTVSGNAGTATALQTGRTIDGQTFDGTANITVIAPGTHAATTKATPADADEFPLVDSAASNVLKKFTGTNLKAYLKSYFDGIYGSVTPPIGSVALVYRYTVTGSDKATIDTGVDTPDAGSNDWTNGDLLEIFLYCRTDETAVISPLDLFLNNDGGANYEVEIARFDGTGSSISAQTNRVGMVMVAIGASGTASHFSNQRVVIPNYAGTVGYKAMEIVGGYGQGTGSEAQLLGGLWRNTAAVNRVAVGVTTAAKKFKVGTQLLIYKRLAS